MDIFPPLSYKFQIYLLMTPVFCTGLVSVWCLIILHTKYTPELHKQWNKAPVY